MKNDYYDKFLDSLLPTNDYFGDWTVANGFALTALALTRPWPVNYFYTQGLHLYRTGKMEKYGKQKSNDEVNFNEESWASKIANGAIFILFNGFNNPTNVLVNSHESETVNFPEWVTKLAQQLFASDNWLDKPFIILSLTAYTLFRLAFSLVCLGVCFPIGWIPLKIAVFGITASIVEAAALAVFGVIKVVSVSLFVALPLGVVAALKALVNVAKIFINNLSIALPALSQSTSQAFSSLFYFTKLFAKKPSFTQTTHLIAAKPIQHDKTNPLAPPVYPVLNIAPLG